MKKYFKAFIRVVKDLDGSFTPTNIIREPLIMAKDKEEVKKILLEKYPQFFQNNKVYSRQVKDEAQFFYVVIFELYNHVIEEINRRKWICNYSRQKHQNKYVDKPIYYDNKLFCRDNEELDYNSGSNCYQSYRDKQKGDIDSLDSEYFVGQTPIYIYKITEKSTNKSYIGKTKNHFIWRWWSHLTKNNTEFGKRLKETKASDWTFEVLEELPINTIDSEVFRVESEYMLKFDTLKNGYNSVISNKEAITNLNNEKQGNNFC